MLPEARKAALSTLVASRCDALPVPVEAIAQTLNVSRISYERLERPGYLVNLGVHGFELFVRAMDPPFRQRFTIAHEMGHAWLEKSGGAPEGSEHATIERWCDTFAAELLMPEAQVMRDLTTREATRVILEGPERYGVSPEAMRVRLAELADILSCYVHVQGDRFRINRLVSGSVLNEAQIASHIQQALHHGEGPQRLVRSADAILRIVQIRGQAEWLACAVPSGSAVFA